MISISAAALDCQHPQTQVEMNECALTVLKREKISINDTYGKLNSRLNSVQKQQLKKAQLAWIKYRDLACQFEASGVAGGSAHAMILTSCITEKTRQRNLELKVLIECQEGNLSCP